MTLVHARSATPNLSVVRESAGRQEEIRGVSQGVLNRLNRIMSEYVRNGLAKGDDFNVLKEVCGTLGTLSDVEMEEVVGLLNTAAATPENAQEPMAKAFSGQQDIVLKLKQILASHERQQDIEALADEVRQLAERQSENLSAEIDVKKLAGEDKSASGLAAVKASEEAQEGEQGAIAGEVKLAAKKLGDVAAGDPKYIDAAGRLAGVEPQTASATDALTGGKIDDAVTAETTTRKTMEDIARALAPEGKKALEATEMAAQLANLEKEQRAHLNQTAKLNAALKRVTDAETPEAEATVMVNQINERTSQLAKVLGARDITAESPEDEIRNAPEMQAFLSNRASGLKAQENAMRSQMAALAGGEAALEAKTQMTQEDLQGAMPEAAVPAADALAQMHAAETALAQRNAGSAAVAEANAANELEQAKTLAVPVGAGPAVANAGTDQQLKQLAKGVADLSAQETKALQQGDAEKTGPVGMAAAAQQDEMATKAGALEQYARAIGSASAQSITRAAAAFQNAAQTMRNGGMAPIAEAAQQEALQNLAQAGQVLAQQTGAAEEKSRELAAMAKAMAGLDRVIQEQQQLGLDTQRAVEKKDFGAGKAIGLARRQERTQQDTASVGKLMTPAMDDSARELENADTAMGEAGQELNGGGLKEAGPAQRKALDALFAAQDGLEAKIEALGAPSAGAQADAMSQLAKAQEEAKAAQAAMVHGDLLHAAAQLGQAARRLVQAGGDTQTLPAAARRGMRAAEKALAAGAADASGGNGNEALEAAGRGEQALSAAQTAMGEAQAGIEDSRATSGAAPQGPAQGSGENATSAGHAGTSNQTSTDQVGSTGRGMAGSDNSAKQWNDEAGMTEQGAEPLAGTGRFLGLPERDRGVAKESQSEKYPQEYGGLVEEYMRSLAGDSGEK
jgi:hypothetical protein